MNEAEFGISPPGGGCITAAAIIGSRHEAPKARRAVQWVAGAGAPQRGLPRWGPRVRPRKWPPKRAASKRRQWPVEAVPGHGDCPVSPLRGSVGLAAFFRGLTAPASCLSAHPGLKNLRRYQFCSLFCPPCRPSGPRKTGDAPPGGRRTASTMARKVPQQGSDKP